MLRFFLIVALACGFTIPFAYGDTPHPMDELAFDVTNADLGEKVRKAWAEHIMRHKGLFVGPVRGDPLKDLWAQRITHFEGSVKINTKTGDIDAAVTVDVKILEGGHKDLYFINFIPITKVEDPNGKPLSSDDVNIWGLKMRHVGFEEELKQGETIKLTFILSGKPDCNLPSFLPIKICGFTDNLAYLASDLFLPGTLYGDFATQDLFITVPVGNVVTSNGITVSITPAEDGFETHHIVQDFPTDARSLAIAPYVTAYLPWENKYIRVNTLSSKNIDVTMATTLLDISNILKFYSGSYGDFLFPKMEASQILDDAGAAFGWPTLLWIPKGIFEMKPNKKNDYVQIQRTALIAHELAHQWFPDMMKLKDSNAAWLSEGFAEFSSVWYMNSVVGEDYDKRVFSQYSLLYRWFVSPQADYGLTSKKAGKVSDPLVYQLVTYYKGATVTNMIKEIIGPQAFITGIKKMHAEIAGKDSYYDTNDLKKYLEEASGMDLTSLFEQWIFNPGWPIYSVRLVRGLNERDISVIVKRGSNIEGRVFSMPVTLLMITDSGEQIFTEMLDKDEQTFTYNLKGRLIRMRFDPNHVFIKKVVPSLMGDADLSGDVDGLDLLYVAWANGGVVGQSWNYIEQADLDNNGSVNDNDLTQLLENFGKIDEETP